MPSEQHPSPLWRFWLFLLVCSGIIWLGGVNARAIIGNDLLRTGTLEFEEFISPEAEREIFRLLSMTSLLIITSYCVLFVSSILFLASSPYSMKEHGWLLMSAILFYLFVPVEAFTMYLDGKMIYQEFFTTVDNVVFRELFVRRMGALKGAPVVALLCYYTIIGLVVFQPFRKKRETA
jgi:hypothetical protein